MTTGRPQQFSQAKVMDNALACFRATGYHATSTRALSAACGVSSSTLYGALGGKQALFVSVVDSYAEQLLASMRALRSGLPAGQQQSARRFFEELFRDVVVSADSDSGRYGCLLFNSLAEFGHSQSVQARHVREALQRIRRYFIDLLREDNPSLEESEASTLADAALVSIAGLRMLLRSGLSKKCAEAVAARMVYSLFYPQEA